MTQNSDTSQKSKMWRTQVWWVPIIVALIGLAGVVVKELNSKSSTTTSPEPFEYYVHVESKSGEDISNAQITIEVTGEIPLNEVTDSTGLARISIDANRSEQSGKLIVGAANYQQLIQNIDLSKGNLPDVIYLEPIALAGSSSQPLPEPSPTMTLPPPLPTTALPTSLPTVEPSAPILIDSFDYSDYEAFTAVWEETTPSQGGRVEIALDTSVFAPEPANNQSIKITTNIPCLEGNYRFQQLQQYWADGAQDWSNSSFLEFWVKGDGIDQAPFVGELSVILIDGDDEVWQSTRFINRDSDWTQISIALVGHGTGNPYQGHENDFIIPEWEVSAGNQQLDTDQIKGILIKSLTTTEWACGTSPDANGGQYPEFTIWIDQMTRH